MKTHPYAWKFCRIYADLPIPIRKEIVAVVDNEPMTFRVIKQELDNKTEIGYEALEQMIRLGIIQVSEKI